MSLTPTMSPGEWRVMPFSDDDSMWGIADGRGNEVGFAVALNPEVPDKMRKFFQPAELVQRDLRFICALANGVPPASEPVSPRPWRRQYGWEKHMDSVISLVRPDGVEVLCSHRDAQAEADFAHIIALVNGRA